MYYDVCVVLVVCVVWAGGCNNCMLDVLTEGRGVCENRVNRLFVAIICTLDISDDGVCENRVNRVVFYLRRSL